MSSSSQTSAAVEEAKSMLVPKLRFPEFQDSDDWNQENMSSVATVVMGSSPMSECYNDIQNGLPLLQGNADIRNRLSAPRVFTSEITKECRIGDILMSVRAPVGSVAKSIHHACIGRGIAAIHAKHPNSQEFLYQWLLSYEPRWANISQGGTFDAINRDDLTQVDLTSPKPTEQQKIADCLSSVDELIAAQARKVDALKTHKKGLMQQLFPRDGEAQPCLRFPEFKNTGEWEEKRLEELVDIQ
jgi:type I restriction enzyme S subunit